MLEKTLQRKVLTSLKKNKNVYSFKTIASNDRGVLDIICCWNGRFVAIEVKAETGKLTVLQALTIEDIQKKGGAAYMVNSFIQFEKLSYLLDGAFKEPLPEPPKIKEMLC